MNSRIAVVTGATSGIGEATAKKLIESGIKIIGNGRNAEKLRQLEKELGGDFIGIAGNVSEEDVQDKMFETAISQFGEEAGIVVVNAGRGLGGGVTSADLSKFEDIIRINLIGAARLMQKAAKKMTDNLAIKPFPEFAKDIVVVGSVVGRNISPFSAVYGSTKFAVHALTEGLRREIAPKGIRVSLVEPGITISGFQDAAGYSDSMVNDFQDRFGPLIYGEDIARAIDFIVNQPPHVSICDIVVRPTRQDYP